MPLPLTFVGTSTTATPVVAQPITTENNVTVITTEDGVTPITTEGT